MKLNKWTLGLAAAGVVSLTSVLQAEEKNSPLVTALGGTTFSGYIDTAATWRLGNNTDRTGAPAAANFVPGTLSNNKADAFALNAVGLSFGKALEEAEWSAGWGVDAIYGPDAVGWNNSFNAGAADVCLKQAYITLRAPVGNGLDFKLGVYDSPLGYESFESYKNPTWTRSYGFGIEASELTGALMSYKFCEAFRAEAGIANRSTPGINGAPGRTWISGANKVAESEKTYLADITMTAPESLGFLAGSTVTAGILNGLAGGVTGTTVSDRTQVYVGATVNTPLEGLKLGVAYDYLMMGGKGQLGSANYANGTYAYTIAGYLTYQATEKLKLATRVEFAKGTAAAGTAGTWYAVMNDSNPQNQLMAVTANVDYSLWENVVSRLEFRWDHDLTGQHLDANVPGEWLGGPFGYDDRNNFVLALNLIYKF